MVPAASSAERLSRVRSGLAGQGLLSPSSSWVPAQRATVGLCSVCPVPTLPLTQALSAAIPASQSCLGYSRTECQEQRALGPCAGDARTPGAWGLSGTVACLQGPLPSPSSRCLCVGKTRVFRLQVPLTVNHRYLSFSHTAHAPSPSTRGVTGGHPRGQARPSGPLPGFSE